MRVAVTGATGFIGRELVKLLYESGDTVRILSRRPASELHFPDGVSSSQIDLTNSDDSTLASFVDGSDILYHAAGQLTDIASMHRLHVDATKRLLAASSGRIGRWVQLSSVGAYGPVSNGIVTEETPRNPVGIYECSKDSSDELVELSARKAAFDYAILRPSNVFGPNMTNQSLFRLIDAIDWGLFAFIGRPGASANYVPVESVVDALWRCGTMPQAVGRVYILSDHRPWEAFVASIAGFLGVSCPRLRLPEAPARLTARLLGRFLGMPVTESRIDALASRCVYSTTRIEQELHFSHPISMEDALFNLVRRRKCQPGKRSA